MKKSGSDNDFGVNEVLVYHTHDPKRLKISTKIIARENDFLINWNVENYKERW